MNLETYHNQLQKKKERVVGWDSITSRTSPVRGPLYYPRTPLSPSRVGDVFYGSYALIMDDCGPLPELVRQDACALDEIDPHWSWYQSDEVFKLFRDTKKLKVVLPPGRYRLTNKMSDDYMALCSARPSNYLGFQADQIRQYAKSLCDPWKNSSKIPLGFPVYSVANGLNYKIPYSCKGTVLSIGGTNYTILTAGSPFVFNFNPNIFDDPAILQFSVDRTGFAFWQVFGPALTSKGYNTQYSKYRVVSAGIRITCTDSMLYAKGIMSYAINNHQGATSFGSGTSGYSAFLASDRTELKAVQPGPLCMLTYEPVDYECLGFIDTTVNDAARQDWSATVVFDNYDSTNGISGYIDICVNYELIVKGTYSELIPSTENLGGDLKDIASAIEAVKRTKSNTYSSYSSAVGGVLRGIAPPGIDMLF